MDSAQLGWVLDVSEIKVATGRDKGGVGSQQIEKWAERAAQMRKYKQLGDKKKKCGFSVYPLTERIIIAFLNSIPSNNPDLLGRERKLVQFIKFYQTI